MGGLKGVLEELSAAEARGGALALGGSRPLSNLLLLPQHFANISLG